MVCGLEVTFGELESVDRRAAGRAEFQGIASHAAIAKRLAISRIAG
jgi:hypothetical protein